MSIWETSHLISHEGPAPGCSVATFNATSYLENPHTGKGAPLASPPPHHLLCGSSNQKTFPAFSRRCRTLLPLLHAPPSCSSLPLTQLSDIWLAPSSRSSVASLEDLGRDHTSTLLLVLHLPPSLAQPSHRL